MASKTISLRPMTTPSSSRVITLTSSRPFLPISSHNTILGVKPLKGVDGRKEGTSLLPEIIYIAHLCIITSYCALFLLRIYMLPPIFIFKNTVARHPDCVLFFLKKKNRSLTWFGGAIYWFWGGEGNRVYNIPWCDFGIVCPGIDQSCFNVELKNEDDKRWLRMPPKDDGLFNGDYQQNPNCYYLQLHNQAVSIKVRVKPIILPIISIAIRASFYLWSLNQIATTIISAAPTINNPYNVFIRITSFIYSSSKQHQP